ncbi:hypothetical protein SBRCBS47491_006137 [Sporothrix bragantina]|uniref:Potassium channel domain-containing protein n=1 Tax=Sporothrix bragantina TaxID=671064 RepID=A0ABP0C2E3_9PEZI
MDDTAGEAVGKYEAQFDSLGRPQQPSRQSSMNGNAMAAVAASVNTRTESHGMQKEGALKSIDAIVTGRSDNLNECIDQLERQRSYSIDRRAMDAAAVAYDKRATALALGFSHDHNDFNLLPSRWWFASSAFPMIAATLGPVASAFSICALVRPWRQEIEDGETIDTAKYIKDPPWLTSVNAIQLFIALVSNIFLLLNMARRVRFTIAQPITMVGWYFSSFALIALTSTASGPLMDGAEPEVDMIWSQAFYYAIYSAILYMVCASLMVVTFYGAWTGHYPKDFQLTNSQRTLMLQTIMFLMYLLIGALVFSNIEGWQYLDAVYWADVTLFTIGFGDFAAETTLGRSLLFPYALIGIISLGLVIGSIRSLALERGRRRLDARMTEKNRRKFLKTLTKKGKDDILQPIRTQSESQDGVLHDGDDHSSIYTGPRPNTSGLTEYERREKEFNIMRKIQRDSARTRRWMALATSTGTWLALWLIGAYIFQTCEYPYQGWNYFDGFYLAFVSLTTIGYGDMVPISNAGRSFFVFWSLLALPATTILISNAGDTIVKSISDATNALGRITILPGERGLKRDFKEVVRAITCGVIFDDVDIEENPPGLLGAAQPQAEEVNEAYAEEEEEEEEEAEEAVNEVESTLHGHNPGDEETGEIKGGSKSNGEPNSNGGLKNANNINGDGNDNSEAGENEKGAQGDIQNASPDSTEQDKETRYRDMADNVNNDADSESQITPPTSTKPLKESSTPSTIKRAHSDLTLSSKTTDNTSNVGGDPGPRRARTGDQMHSSRRSQTKYGQSNGLSSGSGSGNSSSTTSGGYKFGSLPTESMPRLDLPQELPASRAEYHCVLIDEIAQVTEHLRHQPPRKYTFQEWAWFLKLIGEDERNADLHRRAHTKPHKKAERATGGGYGRSSGKKEDDKHRASKQAKNSLDLNPDNEDPSQLQWSWVGARSPLMGSQEEAEWIRDKLTKRLQAELRTTREAIAFYRKRHLERREADKDGHGNDVDDDDEKSRDRLGLLGKEHHHSRARNDQQHADPGPYSGSGHLKRRETHAIEEEET